jgi:hypothetical protein
MLVFIILIFCGLLVFPVLFQEGNPIPVLNGIIKLSTDRDKFVQISDNPQEYISKTSVYGIPLIDYMKADGWIFDEQAGSGYIFIKGNRQLTVTSVQYTRKYTIWKFDN